MPTLLHVGCGQKRKDRTTPGFQDASWQEVRLDIDPDVNPDIVGTMTDMSGVADASVDALYSSHNIEHLYAYEVEIALKEFARVVRPDGFVVITCPDIQSIAALVAQGKLVEPAYTSPAGPISPIDMLFGLRSALARGNHYMAHRCGFTLKVLMGTMKVCGFTNVVGMARPSAYELWVVGSKTIQEPALRTLATEHFPGRPS